MNANKRRREHGKIKIAAKIISIVLIMSMIISGNIFVVNAETLYENTSQTQNDISGVSMPSDPLEFMQDSAADLPQVPPNLAGNLADPENTALSDGQPNVDLQPAQNNGSTDRYIVKYKPGKKDSFKTKMSAKVANGKALGLNNINSLTNNKGKGNKNSNAYTNNGKGKGNGTNKKSTLETNDWEVLTLNEETLPSEFAADIKASQADTDILYIQPDYALSLDSINEDIAPVDDSANTESELTGNEEDVTPADGDGEKIEENPADNSVVQTTSEDITSQIGEETSNAPADGDIIVAVIDTGMDINHPDLAGYVDTAGAWDFTQNTNVVYSSDNPLEYAHGTHIAGTIINTARENGVINVKILPLRVFNNSVAYTSDIIAAIDYAVSNGASIINCSFGSTEDNPALEEMIASSDALFICAVGNSRRDLTETPSYPACYDLTNIISVASVNADGGFSYFSNYGTNVDITALGREVMSSLPENQHGTMTGTSMSASYVTAVAAVVDAKNGLSTDELKSRLLDTADMLSNLQDKVNEGRRINLVNALNNNVQAAIIQNNSADDFDVTGHKMTESDLFELYNSNNILQMTEGQYYTLALKSDGTVWAWGYNSYGQCGNGSIGKSEKLTQVVGLSSIIAIVAWQNHSMALKSDGTVWAWGYNSNGQLGDGTTTQRTTPVQVTGLSGIIAISAGSSHSMALKSDGTVWAWGYNGYGQLGDGTTTQRTTPVQVTGLSGIIAISAGDSNSMALKSDGTVWAWGYNYYGLLGDGTTVNKSTPVQVTGLSGIIAISAGNSHSMALKSDGTVWAWGYNYYGLLGDGTTVNKSTPVQVIGLSNV
ncbi:MAG: S8 family serine peptidase, partial [Oscillospiraceae bacterium]|nr:S8 family serine peptidase [Oscillospiraceae bacterium]